MVVIDLYKCSCDNNVVDKSGYMSFYKAVGGTFRDNVDIYSPTILIEESSLEFNYVYIRELNRYYYCINMTIVRSKSSDTYLLEVDLRVDTLMTYKDKLLDCYVCPNRVSTPDEMNQYTLIDNKIPVERKPNIRYSFGSDNALVSDFNSQNHNTFENILVICTACTDNTDGSLYSYGIKEDSSNNTVFNRPYAMGKKTFNRFSQLVLRGSASSLFNIFGSPAQNIASIYYCPFSVYNIWSKTFETTYYQRSSKMVLGNIELNLHIQDKDNVGIAVTAIYSNTLFEIDGGTIKIPKMHEDDYAYADYNPYTTIDIFIPFYGWLTISPDLVSGLTLRLTYVWDMFTGKATGYLYRDGMSYKTNPLYVVDVQLCVEMPIGSSNIGEVRRNLLLAAGNIIMSTVNITSKNAISDIKAPKKYTSKTGKITKAYQKYSAIKDIELRRDISSAILENTSDIINGSVQHSSVGQTSGGLTNFSVTKMIARITSINFIANKRYTNDYIGYPAIIPTLFKNTPYGILIANDIHLDNVNCLNIERDDLISIFSEGVRNYKTYDIHIIPIDSNGNLLTFEYIDTPIKHALDTPTYIGWCSYPSIVIRITGSTRYATAKVVGTSKFTIRDFKDNVIYIFNSSGIFESDLPITLTIQLTK